MKQRLQSILIQISGAITFLFVGLITFLFSFISLKITYKLANYACRLFLLSMGVRLQINGKFPDKGVYIIMFNHSSFIDPFLLPVFTKGKYTGVVAQENLDIFLFGWILKRFKCIPIDRQNTVSAINNISKAGSVIKRGYHIGILPEGTRSLTGKMKPFKKGGFYMAMNTKTPILPVGIIGAYDFKPKNRNTIKPGIVKITIGEPIYPKANNKLELEKLLKQTEDAIKRLCYNSRN
ncbi:MAG: 1-acyl-sn-glycerol-3-phosphate acyltransferase [Candidatus Marinimicrobia bacterium]|nr:1-acyl-sn-glycerol-3-phosphate acyltransferase [Candidatus Neomarinimicrobiota bacterium]MBL7022519.1 1-acyl-sn-glycerol-3-phosphate acyltransferase [Candidatus Neomarinimicrobiota bacterium]MBL7108626.1 1-acyl-sn-glycerol-3-phosphate acyltransferase [Candidatus Neomarinimicrobiota bacterium]